MITYYETLRGPRPLLWWNDTLQGKAAYGNLQFILFIVTGFSALEVREKECLSIALLTSHKWVKPAAHRQPRPSLMGRTPSGGGRYLVVQEGFGLLGVPQELLVAWDWERRLGLFSHTVEPAPACVQGLQPRSQEHVLGICLALGDHLAHVPHLLVVLLVVVNLVFDVLVLREELLGLGQGVRHVLRGNGSLWVLESQDWKSAPGPAGTAAACWPLQGGLTVLQRGLHLLPHVTDLGQPRQDSLGLVGVLGLQPRPPSAGHQFHAPMATPRSRPCRSACAAGP